VNDTALLPLFAIVGGALVLATAVSSALAARQRKKGPVSATVTNLVQRVRAWWLMVAILVVMSLVGSGAMFVLYGLLSMLALREFITISPTHRADHRAIAATFFVLIPSHYIIAATGWYGMFLIDVPVYGFVAIAAMLVLAGNPQDFLQRMAKLQWGALVAIYFVSYVPMLSHLRFGDMPTGSPRLVFFLVFVAQMSDVLQYVSGKLIGRRPLAPTISPNKTVEGLIGGGSLAALLGAAMHLLTPFGPVGSGLLALTIVVNGAVGGLVMSAVKRSLNAKDWGAAIAGHGGIMDRLDSVVFSAPMFFHFVVYYGDLQVPNTRAPWIDALLHIGS